jgi:hypothetical protein
VEERAAPGSRPSGRQPSLHDTATAIFISLRRAFGFELQSPEGQRIYRAPPSVQIVVLGQSRDSPTAQPVDLDSAFLESSVAPITPVSSIGFARGQGQLARGVPIVPVVPITVVAGLYFRGPGEYILGYDVVWRR